ncbi:MAG: CATRA conflict system CASPASE/TPR repeat-associated protein [Mycobacterium sp.]
MCTFIAFNKWDAGGPAGSLAAAWETASKLGITREAEGFGVSRDLPNKWPDEDEFFRLVAAKSDTLGRNLAVAFTTYDTAGVIVKLRPATETATSKDLVECSRAWIKAAPHHKVDPNVFGGETHIYCAVVPDTSPSIPNPEALNDVARTLLAEQNRNPTHTSFCLAVPGVGLWQGDTDGGRSFVAFACEDAAAVRAIDDWFWVTQDNDNVGQLIRWLLQASKLGFAVQQYRDNIGKVRDQEYVLEQGLERLNNQHEKFELKGAGADDLIAAQSALVRAQADSTGLMRSVSNMMDLRRMAATTAADLPTLAPELAPGSIPPTPFTREEEIAKWFDQRLGSEIDYLEASRARVKEAHNLIDLRLKQFAAENARQANLLSALQTSILGALLGAFSVGSALAKVGRIEASFIATVIVAVMSALFVVPILVARWTSRYGWPELVAAGFAGATAGWALVGWAGPHVALAGISLYLIQVASAAVGFGLVAFVAIWSNDRAFSLRGRSLDS